MIDRNPLMPCNVLLAGRAYPIGSSFREFIDAVLAMERELGTVKVHEGRANRAEEELKAAKFAAKRAFEELTKSNTARADLERQLAETRETLMRVMQECHDTIRVVLKDRGHDRS